MCTRLNPPYFKQNMAQTLIQQAHTAIKNSAFLAAGLLLPALCTAQSAPSPQDTALLAGNCITCHGPGGQPPAGAGSSIPALRGQSAAAIRPIELSPVLLLGLDSQRREGFLTSWRAAFAPR